MPKSGGSTHSVSLAQYRRKGPEALSAVAEMAPGFQSSCDDDWTWYVGPQSGNVRRVGNGWYEAALLGDESNRRADGRGPSVFHNNVLPGMLSSDSGKSGGERDLRRDIAYSGHNNRTEPPNLADPFGPSRQSPSPEGETRSTTSHPSPREGVGLSR